MKLRGAFENNDVDSIEIRGGFPQKKDYEMFLTKGNHHYLIRHQIIQDIGVEESIEFGLRKLKEYVEQIQEKKL